MQYASDSSSKKVRIIHAEKWIRIVVVHQTLRINLKYQTSWIKKVTFNLSLLLLHRRRTSIGLKMKLSRTSQNTKPI